MLKYKNKTKTLKVLKKLFKIYTKVIPTIFKWIQSHTLCQGWRVECTTVTDCPFGQKVRRGGVNLSHSVTIATPLSCHDKGVAILHYSLKKFF